MHKLTLFPMLVVLSVWLAACGTAKTPEATRVVNVALSTSPSPAIVGDVELILTITGENGELLEGATVDVSADHTDMTGMGMSGLATEQGEGRYSINANFSMSGNWKITVYVRKGELD